MRIQKIECSPAIRANATSKCSPIQDRIRSAVTHFECIKLVTDRFVQVKLLASISKRERALHHDVKINVNINRSGT